MLVLRKGSHIQALALRIRYDGVHGEGRICARFLVKLLTGTAGVPRSCGIACPRRTCYVRSGFTSRHGTRPISARNSTDLGAVLTCAAWASSMIVTSAR